MKLKLLYILVKILVIYCKQTLKSLLGMHMKHEDEKTIAARIKFLYGRFMIQ